MIRTIGSQLDENKKKNFNYTEIYSPNLDRFNYRKKKSVHPARRFFK